MQVRDRSEATVARPELLLLLDVAVGVSAQAVTTAGAVRHGVRSVAGPVAEVVLRPPVVARRLQPATWLDGFARRGAVRRGEMVRGLSAALDLLVPAVVVEVVRRLDLVALVRKYVDLDRIIAEVDLDSAVSRVDLDAVVGRLDMDAVVARLDLNRIVRERLDLDGLVADVDLDAAAARLDVEAIIERVDVVGIARDVIAEIDLPEIIRESSGTMAAETLQGVRMQSMHGDDAISRVVDRLVARKGRGRAATPSPEVPPLTPRAP